MSSPEIERLIQLLAKLPGLGPRSARRAVLALIRRRETLLTPLAKALNDAAEAVRVCSTCGNVDSRDPCTICADGRRDVSFAAPAAPSARTSGSSDIPSVRQAGFGCEPLMRSRKVGR